MKKNKKLSNENKIVEKDFDDTFFKITLGFNTKIGQILYFLFLDIYLLTVFMITFYIKNFDNHFFRIGFVVVMTTISLAFFYVRFFLFFNCRKRNSILYNFLCWILIALYIFLFIHTLPPRGGGTWSERLDIVPNILIYLKNLL